MTSNTVDTVDAEPLAVDDLHVVEPRAAGLDVHKMCIIAAVRLYEVATGTARAVVKEFSALPCGLRAMTDWLLAHGVTAAAMEGTGVYWKAPFEALEDAGIRAELFHAQHVKQIRGKKTDVNDSLWLARICQFGLAQPSFVPPRHFRHVRQLTRYRRKLVAERSRNRNRVHKTLDHDGLRIGGILSDIFGVNGRRILDGLVAGDPPHVILTGLTNHVRAKLEPLARALAATLDPTALVLLKMQIADVDRTDTALAALDTHIRGELADYQRPLTLLQTIPGIDFGSACTILAEVGPNLEAFREARHLGAWAGVAPATTPAPASVAPGAHAKGTRPCGPPSPNAPTAPSAPRAPSFTTITGPTPPALATNAPFSPRRTSCCG